jgi:hypothetical protein
MAEEVWPVWWTWNIELSPHLLKRMIDRRFTEAELRAMMEDARGFRVSADPARFIVETRHEGQNWEIIVEPDEGAQLLVIVTAYACH